MQNTCRIKWLGGYRETGAPAHCWWVSRHTDCRETLALVHLEVDMHQNVQISAVSNDAKLEATHVSIYRDMDK